VTSDATAVPTARKAVSTDLPTGWKRVDHDGVDEISGSQLKDWKGPRR